jgi:hypothetical protein
LPVVEPGDPADVRKRHEPGSVITQPVWPDDAVRMISPQQDFQVT